MTRLPTPVPALAAAIRIQAGAIGPARALLVGLSGIDGAGKGYVAAQLNAELCGLGLRTALINVDGWLNLPPLRFATEDPARHFYTHALRLDALFQELILPLQRTRSIRLTADLADETAPAYHAHCYEFGSVDVILLEGIYIYKRAYRPHFDVAVWVDCSFGTALARAVARGQEGLSPNATIRAYETIYFPAQRLHFAVDRPREAADVIVANDPGVYTVAGAGQPEVPPGGRLESRC